MSAAFTKEDLIQIQGDHCQPLYYQLLAAHALAQTERVEKAEARLNSFVGRLSMAVGSPCVKFGGGKTIEEAVVEFVEQRVKDYIATVNERDRLAKELSEAEDAIRSVESAINNSGVNRDVKAAFGAHPAVRRARERANGFTLIELLIVVALAFTVFAIIYGAVMSHRETAKCLNGGGVVIEKATHTTVWYTTTEVAGVTIPERRESTTHYLVLEGPAGRCRADLSEHDWSLRREGDVLPRIAEE